MTEYNTKCPECGTEMVIMECQVVIPQTHGYRVIFGCTVCPTKLEAHRTLVITEIGKIIHLEELIREEA